MIKQALISVSDKTGVLEFARTLQSLGVRILSTGGTAKLLVDNGIPVTEVAQYTGFPEMLDGRVKTLHPKIHGGILARRDYPAHMAALEKENIEPIDMVVVNLYPFQETIARSGCLLEEAIENIDIGGPAMLRSSAKNYQDVTVICDPSDYARVVQELTDNQGETTSETRFLLAKKAFAHTARYDAAIADYLAVQSENKVQPECGAYPNTLHLHYEKVQTLRYGENPHQEAAFYREARPYSGALANYTQWQGKELSYNNIADADAAWECVKTFDEAACVIIKHANPCGVAMGASPLEAYGKALQTDPTSAFGGIIAFNRTLDGDTAEMLVKQFVEVLIAPAFTDAARQLLMARQNLRVLQIPLGNAAGDYDVKRVGGGLLVQSPDAKNIVANGLKVVSRKQPTAQQVQELLFAWRVAKFVKSNAIVFCANGMTMGIGAGQMSRIDSARIACIKAQNAGLSLAGTAVASDAFFPFRDGLDVVVAAGATSVIHPGGSVRDEEVIAAADEHGIVMIQTGVRHFRH